MKKALITGITGQDGSYLAELLATHGYEVHGIVRNSTTFKAKNIKEIFSEIDAPEEKIQLHHSDLTDAHSLQEIVKKIQPDELYNLGAQSHVGMSFDAAELTGNITGLGATRLLVAIHKYSPHTKFYQASSSEMFGKVHHVPQTEETPFHPRSPYGVAKMYAHWMAINFRESYNLFACNGILFNHESPRRGENFVTRKITKGLARISLGLEECLYLGNLEAKRDWGFAKDYVEAMWTMLQQPTPDDYVIATNETHSVREFIMHASNMLGFDIEWQGAGVEEKGIDRKTRKTIIAIDPKFFRPAEVDLLIGDYSKAKSKLGWQPRTSFAQLAEIMVTSDLEREKKLNS